MQWIGQRVVGVLIMIGLAGCANLVQPEQSPLASPLTSPVAAPTGVILRYQRQGGIGGFDETWAFYADGRVTHAGRGAGADRQLTPDQAAALIGALRAANLVTLNESYLPANTCCDRFTHTLTSTLDGQTKTVRTLDAAPDEPPALRGLITTLNGLVQ
jgi:hypothetical protein